MHDRCRALDQNSRRREPKSVVGSAVGEDRVTMRSTSSTAGAGFDTQNGQEVQFHRAQVSPRRPRSVLVGTTAAARRRAASTTTTSCAIRSTGRTDDSSSPATDTPAPLTQWVDPFIGTGGVGWGVGTTYPGPQIPFGMVRAGPDTSHLKSAFARRTARATRTTTTSSTASATSASTARASPTTAAPRFMPTIGMSADEDGAARARLAFRSRTEKATPGYYAVTLADTNVDVELTASARVAFHRYTFPANSDAVVIVDDGSPPRRRPERHRGQRHDRRGERKR